MQFYFENCLVPEEQRTSTVFLSAVLYFSLVWLSHMAQCLTLHTNIHWPSQGPSKLLNWIFCNAYLFVFINKNLLISCYISMITKLSSDDEPSFKMLFRNRFLSMIDYATNYCTSVRALNSFRAHLDFFKPEPQNKKMSNDTLRRAALRL